MFDVDPKYINLEATGNSSLKLSKNIIFFFPFLMTRNIILITILTQKKEISEVEEMSSRRGNHVSKLYCLNSDNKETDM